MNKIGILLKCCVLSGFLIFVSSVSAQISYGGQPYSFSNQGLRARTAGAENVSTYIVEDLDREEIKRELEERGGNCRECSDGFYYGKEVYTRIDFFRSAQKIETGNDEKVWLLKIESEKAEGYQLIFSKFKMAKGAKLFVYNEDRSMLLGSFTSENNREDKTFLTQYINGRSIYVEYVAPAGAKKSTIFIDRVVYIFDKCFVENKGPFSENGSAKCQINTSCPEGDGRDIGIKSTVMILGKDATNNKYWGICTGVLINDGMNYGGNNYPYLLTANHCYENTKTHELGDPGSWVFLFRHEATSCSSDGSELTTSTTKSALGASVSSRDVGSVNSDYLLLKLNNTVASIAKYDIAFAGYDYGEPLVEPGSPEMPVYAVHHPQADVKKITITEKKIKSVGWPTDENGNSEEGNDHWKVQATTGFKAEHGSSGGPLFNSLHRVIGQCHGGIDQTCDSEKSLWQTFYGKLSSANKNGSIAKDLKFSLTDPYVPPTDMGDVGSPMEISYTVSDAIEDRSPTVTCSVRGKSVGSGETAKIGITLNKMPFDTTTYYPIVTSIYHYYEEYVVTLTKQTNADVVYASKKIILHQITEPGEYKAIIRVSRSSEDYKNISMAVFTITVTSAATCTCANVNLEVINPQSKYAPGSRITVRESAQVPYNKRITTSGERPDCYEKLSYGSCSGSYRPRYYGIQRRQWSLDGAVFSSDTFTTAYEYISTNPGKYYTPSSKQVELSAPGVYKVQVFMDLATSYENMIYTDCDPRPGKVFYTLSSDPSKAIYAKKKIVVANCDGTRVPASPEDRIFSPLPSDDKSVGVGNMRIMIEFDKYGEYAVEAYKSIKLEPGAWIPAGAKFTAKIVPCPSVVRSALAEVADFRVSEILPTGEMTSTDVLDSNSSEIVVYPNPTSGEVNVMTPEYVEINKVAVYDMNGSLLKTIDNAMSLRSLDLSFLDNGAYVLYISSSMGEVRQQILIRK